MILVFGGAYQGKLRYAREELHVETVCDCGEGRVPDFTKDAVYGLEGFVKRCAEEGTEAADFFKDNRDQWQDKVMIITDVSQGVVPVEAVMRRYREMNGRLMTYLAGEAEQVIRVFCGIGKKAK